jgi:hypothetical protein
MALISLSLTGAILSFLMSSPSAAVWNAVGPLQKIQFPWRILSVASLVIAVGFPLAAATLIERYQHLRRAVVYSIVSLVLAITLFDLTQTILMAAPLPKEKFQEMVVDKRAEESCTCWWPLWADRSALEKSGPVVIGEREVSVSAWHGENRQFEVGDGEAGDARVAIFYYPYWHAQVNGKDVSTAVAQDGTIVVPVPSGRSVVSLTFDEPMFLAAAKGVSLAVWFGLLFALLATAVSRRKQGAVELAWSHIVSRH